MSANKKTAARRAVSPKFDQMFLLGRCDSRRVLPLPAPTKQTHRAKA